jgi:SOS response regulatory protein OraA/RecX
MTEGHVRRKLRDEGFTAEEIEERLDRLADERRDDAADCHYESIKGKHEARTC